MKQIKKMLLVSFLAVVSILFFASCGNKTHTHNFVKGDLIEASCTEKGYTIYKCDCGETEQRDEVSALGHSYGAWVVTKEATTSEKGTKEKTCTRCTDKVTEEIPLKEQAHVHTYSSWEVVTSPTLENSGLLTKNCTSLDDSITKVLPALNETDYTIDETTLVLSTCTQTGSKEYVYTIDGQTFKFKVSTEALGHSYGAWVVTKESTTSEKGIKEKTCTVCGDKVTEEVPLKEETHVHSYTSWEVVTNPTLENTGLLTKNCTSLDDSITKVLPALNETDYTIDETTLVLPTCTKAGLKEYVYTIDGQTFKFKVKLEVLDHTMVETSKDATCTEAGYVKNTCSVCGYEEVETHKALGHTPLRNGHECEADKVCLVCNVVLEKKVAHKLTEDLVEATCTTLGKITYTCDYCGEVIDEVSVAKKEHQLSDFTVSGVEEATTTSCLYKQAYKATCSDCGEEVYKYEEVYHHTYELESTVLATCTSKGVLTYKCNGCENEITKALEVNSEAHNYTLISTSTDSKLVYECDHCHNEKTVLNHSAVSEATVSETDIKDAKAIELSGNTSITLDENILSNILTDVTIKADAIKADTLSLSDEKKNLIGDNPVYDFELRDSNNDHIGFNNGKATIRIPYTLKDGEDPTDICVWYINENGETTTIKAQYVSGYAIFETEHFSYYAVSKLTDTEKCELYGHHYIKGSQIDATCTENGHYSEICSVCGDKQTTKILAIGHKFSQTSLTEATCLTNGKRIETCANCGQTKEYFIPALGHDYKLDSEKSTTATCAHGGHEEYKCSRCDDSFITNTIQLNHQYVNTIVDPTCTEQGYTLHKCLVCNEEYKDTYTSALGHDYIETIVNPTCTAQGYTLYTCSICNDSYKDNFVSARHTWNVESPTCGVGQECTICHTLGLPATGDHHYENGVCSVCKDGCDHTYDEMLVNATCTTDGYTLKTCSICGHEEKVNVVSKTGHKGNLLCDVCGQTIVSSEYIENLLTSPLKYDSFTITGKDLKINFVSSDTKQEINIATISLNLKLDDSGKLYGNGYVEFSLDQEGNQGNATAKIYIKDDYIYIENIESYYSSMKNGDYTYSHTESTYDEKSHYYKYKLDDLFKQMGISSIYDIINSIDSVSLDKICDALVKISTNDNYFVNKAIVYVINKLFILDTTSKQYKLSLNLNYFVDIYEYAKTHTISEVIDYATSDGAFNTIYYLVTKADKITVGDIINNIEVTGLTLEEIITILNNNINTGSEDSSFEDMINSYLNNNDQTLIEYLNSPDISSQCLFTFVKNITNNTIDLTTYQNQLKEMLDNYKDANIFDLIAQGADKEQVISFIDEYVNQYKDLIGLDIYTNSYGEVTKTLVSVKGNVGLDSNHSAELDITLNTTFNNLVSVDQNLIAKIDALYTLDLKKAIENSDIELVKDESGNVIGFVYSYIYESEYTNDYDYYTEVITYSTKYVYQITFDNLTEAYKQVQYIDSDCNNWYKYNLHFNGENIGTSVETRTMKYYNQNGILVSQRTVTYSSNNNCYYLILFYNTKSGKVVLDGNNKTMHNFKLTDSKEASGCTGVGYNKYICTDCGYQKCDYYVNGHKHYTTTYELVNPNSNCKDGVKVIRTCSDCSKIFVDYVSYSHQMNSHYELIEGATSCEDGLIWVDECEVCGEKTYHEDNVRHEHSMQYKEEDLSRYGLNGTFIYYECQYCHTYADLKLNIKEVPTNTYSDDATNTQVFEYANGNVIYTEKVTSTTNGCVITKNTEKKVALKNKDSYKTYSTYETNYITYHDYERNDVTNGLTKTESISCTKCGMVQEKIITTYYDSEFNNIETQEIYHYEYDSNYNLSYYAYDKYNYDQNGNRVKEYSEYKHYQDGEITYYEINKSSLINNKLVEVESSYIWYEAGVLIDSEKRLYTYDIDNCQKITHIERKYYQNGELYNEQSYEESEIYHFEYTHISDTTCTQFEILECTNCKTQITGSYPLRHLNCHYDENNNRVCLDCGLVLDSDDKYSLIYLEELDSENSNIVVGYCYNIYKNLNFSEPILTLLVNGTSYDLDITVDKTYTCDNSDLSSGKYYISLDSIKSFINEISAQFEIIETVDLKLEVIESETKTNTAIILSILELIQE